SPRRASRPGSTWPSTWSAASAPRTRPARFAATSSTTRSRRTSERPRAYTRRVDPQALQLLEFPAIRERLAAMTATSHGAEAARTLDPSSDGAEVTRRQALTAEAIALLNIAAEPPLEGIHDVREAAARAG